jgi:ribosomal protein S18 acetylase RimI-like enzyme
MVVSKGTHHKRQARGQGRRGNPIGIPVIPAAQRSRPQIRQASTADHGAVWEIFHAVVAPGDTYAFDPDISRADALAYWLDASNRCYVAEREGSIVGTYILRPNQPGLGSHVANAAFMVAPQARGLGVGRAMGEHSLVEARRLGYRAMQFNFVVSTNEAAVGLWRDLGFDIVGTLPGAFRHSQRGFVDAYVMFQSLSAD